MKLESLDEEDQNVDKIDRGVSNNIEINAITRQMAKQLEKEAEEADSEKNCFEKLHIWERRHPDSRCLTKSSAMPNCENYKKLMNEF